MDYLIEESQEFKAYAVINPITGHAEHVSDYFEAITLAQELSASGLLHSVYYKGVNVY